MKIQKTPSIKSNPEEKDTGGITVSDFKLYNRVMIKKAA
jgi:hypothetical protein